MISVPLCAASANLRSSEVFLGVTPSARHRSMLIGYLLNLKRGPVAVRDMIIADLRAALDLGAQQRAADLLIVLRLFLSEHPEARYGSPRVARVGMRGQDRNGAILSLRRRHPIATRRKG